MFERLFGDRRGDPALADRDPPGQYVTEKFPVLHYGSVPQVDLATWDFKVYGEVDSPFRLTWDEFKALPRKQVDDRHPLRHPVVEARHTLGGRADPDDPRARPGPADRDPRRRPRRAGLHGQRAAEVLDDDDVLLADTFDGEPLEPEHGYPMRLIVPKRYFWKGPKWLRGLEFLDHDMLGFWERYGYNNDADPGRKSATPQTERLAFIPAVSVPGTWPKPRSERHACEAPVPAPASRWFARHAFTRGVEPPQCTRGIQQRDGADERRAPTRFAAVAVHYDPPDRVRASADGRGPSRRRPREWRD